MCTPKTMASQDGSKLSEEDKELLRKSGLSDALKETIKEKLERGELDEVDHNIFEENLKKTVKKRD